MGISDEKTVTSRLASPEQSLVLTGVRPGSRIHQYEIIRSLGRGGMGEVFLARDTRLARRVALKFLTGAEGQTDRLLAEARVTARCTHENIVVIHEVDVFQDRPYMVLEYLEGRTLRSSLDNGSVSPARAIELVLPVVRALTRAHEFDIVHRDLKPENVFVTVSGTVKVLDFGIAKLLGWDQDLTSSESLSNDPRVTSEGAFLGTVPYMSPEQFGADTIDHRTDLWAVGMILFELVAGKHPYAPVSLPILFASIPVLSLPMPSLPADLDVPQALRDVINRCLAKRKYERFSTAHELGTTLEALLPGREGRLLTADECPFPGLAAFQESDANRFYGRASDVSRVLARIRDQALLGFVGPSGVGKSSLVRAGLIPALKASGEPWEVLSLRPGRTPLAQLAALIGGDATLLINEPGALGEALRLRAQRNNSKLLLFIDQFEELYTLGADDRERAAFTSSLEGVADDANSALRVAVAMRSDFLDRVAEAPRFLDELTRGLLFLQPMPREGLREALARPLEALRYAFESPDLVDQMVDALATTPAALPLLQFAAARLWDGRDKQRKLLTHASHAAMGGVSGALSTHADQVLGTLTQQAQRLARAVFRRLVTAERTRAVVDRDELHNLVQDGASVEVLVDHLLSARLLVVQTSQIGEATIEIVHESLIGGWPTLRRWLDEDQDNAAYLEQIQTAARQWDQKGRAVGLLWRGEAEREARHFADRYRGDLARRDREFLDAVFQLGSRSARIRVRVMFGSFALLAAIIIASAIALVTIRNAQHRAEAEAVKAQSEKSHAENEATRAQQEAARAHSAEAREKAQLEQTRSEQSAKERAEGEAQTNLKDAQMSRGQLQEALSKAERQKSIAEQESERAREAEKHAQEAAAQEKKTRQEAEALYQREKARTQQLEERGKQITNQLP